MNHVVESIHHFTCEHCKGWWSIATHERWQPRKMFCPWCGKKQETLQTRDVETGEVNEDN